MNINSRKMPRLESFITPTIISDFLEGSQFNLGEFGKLSLPKNLNKKIKVTTLFERDNLEHYYLRVEVEGMLTRKPSKSSALSGFIDKRELYLWIRIRKSFHLKDLIYYLNSLISEETDDFIDFFNHIEVVAASFFPDYFEMQSALNQETSLYGNISYLISEDINIKVLQFIFSLVDGASPALQEAIQEFKMSA